VGDYWAVKKPGNGKHKRWVNIAISLLEGLDIKVLLTDKGYDTNAILEYTQERGITSLTPPKHNREIQRKYDKDLRYLVKNDFLYLKHWRGIATRYAKNAASFLAAIHTVLLLLFLIRNNTI